MFELEMVLRVVVIGVGATFVMDIWALLQKKLFDIPSLNYALVGRWLGHMLRGQVKHSHIGQAQPIAGEGVIGWVAHYGIGVVFAGILVAVAGEGWAENPSFAPAFVFGLLSVIMPFFVMQPGFGFGVAAARTPSPSTARLRSLVAHGSFGIGLYLAAVVAAMIL